YTSTHNKIVVQANNPVLTRTGKAPLSMTAGSQITIGVNSVLTNTYSGDLDPVDAIVLEANNDDTPFSITAANHGISLSGTSHISTAAGGAGNISLWGRGGGGANGMGIQLNGGSISSLGAGSIDLEGYGSDHAEGN